MKQKLRILLEYLSAFVLITLLLLAIASVVVAGSIGVPLAFVFERLDFPVGVARTARRGVERSMLRIEGAVR